MSATLQGKIREIKREMTSGAGPSRLARSRGAIMSCQNLRERIDEAAVLFSSTSPLLESQHVETTVKQTAVVGELSFDFLRQVATTTEFVKRNARDGVEKLGIPDLIDSAAFALHQGRLPAGRDEGWVGVYRRPSTPVGMNLEVKMRCSPLRIARRTVVTDDIPPAHRAT